MPMIIANVRRSRRSCRSSLTMIEPNLRSCMAFVRAGPVRISVRGRDDEYVLEIRADRVYLRLDSGALEPLGHLPLEVLATFREHAQRRADLRHRDDARHAVELALRLARFARFDQQRAAWQVVQQIARRAVGHDAAAIQDREPRAALGL